MVNETSVEDTTDLEACRQDESPCSLDEAWGIAERWAGSNGFAGVLTLRPSRTTRDHWVAKLARPSRWPVVLRRLKYRFDEVTGREPRCLPSLIIRKKDGRIVRAPNVRGRREKIGSSARRGWWLHNRKIRTAQPRRRRSGSRRQKEANPDGIVLGSTSFLDLIAEHHPAVLMSRRKH